MGGYWVWGPKAEQNGLRGNPFAPAGFLMGLCYLTSGVLCPAPLYGHVRRTRHERVSLRVARGARPTGTVRLRGVASKLVAAGLALGLVVAIPQSAAAAPEIDDLSYLRHEVGRPSGPDGEMAPGPGEEVFRVVIPRLDLDEPVYAGATATWLAKGVTHYPACRSGFPLPFCSPFREVWPGEKGRAVIAGHRTIKPAPFLHADKLRRGDEIFTVTDWGTFRYRVTHRSIVHPQDRNIIVPGVEGRELVIVTCHPKYSEAQRMIVHARLSRPAVAKYGRPPLFTARVI